jgi:hypothetical protein
VLVPSSHQLSRTNGTPHGVRCPAPMQRGAYKPPGAGKTPVERAFVKKLEALFWQRRVGVATAGLQAPSATSQWRGARQARMVPPAVTPSLVSNPCVGGHGSRLSAEAPEWTSAPVQCPVDSASTSNSAQHW